MRYEVQSVLGGDANGFVTTDDDGIITAYDGTDITAQEAVVLKMTPDALVGRNKMITLVPVDGNDEGQPPVAKTEKTLSERLAEARADLRQRVAKDADDVTLVAGEIVKTDPAKRLVFGWAYITHDRDGLLNIDKSGDFADDIEEIEKSAYDFVLRSRAGDADHTNVKTSDLVESMVFTPEKIAKMGIPDGVMPLGWWVGFKVGDDETWARVEKRELTSFSVHGKGTRKSVAE